MASSSTGGDTDQIKGVAVGALTKQAPNSVKFLEYLGRPSAQIILLTETTSDKRRAEFVPEPSAAGHDGWKFPK